MRVASIKTNVRDQVNRNLPPLRLYNYAFSLKLARIKGVGKASNYLSDGYQLFFGLVRTLFYMES
jgi:hypothetical protein